MYNPMMIANNNTIKTQATIPIIRTAILIPEEEDGKGAKVVSIFCVSKAGMN